MLQSGFFLHKYLNKILAKLSEFKVYEPGTYNGRVRAAKVGRSCISMQSGQGIRRSLS